MPILLTGHATPLGRAIADRLAGHGHFITTLPDRTSLPGNADNEPRDVASLTEQLRDVEAIVHAENFAIDDGADEALAFHRATTDIYHLCQAAVAAGVDRIIAIGSLNIYDAVPWRYLVDEMWRPRPEPKPRALLPYLASGCVREFVRHGSIKGVCLRLAPIGDDPETETRLDDALQAIERALELAFDPSGYRWHVIHVANSLRFLNRDARRILGFEPKAKPYS